MRDRRFGYRPALDGVRGVAITLVVCFHAFGWPTQGNLGVDLFFVLSGFLITSLLVEEWQRSGSIHIGRFYRRRARRLLPALFVMLLPYLILASVLAASNHRWLFGLASALTYTSNILVAANPSGMPPGLIHLWSLAAEEQFYIVWPLLLLLVLRTGGRRWLGRGLVTLLLVLTVYRLTLISHGASGGRIYYGPDTHADPLVIGCLFGWLFMSGRKPKLLSRFQSNFAGITAFVFLMALVLLGARIPQRASNSGELTVAFALLAGVLIVCATKETNWLTRGLSARPLRALGRISYSLYLWHLPLLVLFGIHREVSIRAGSVLVLALVVASISRHFVELPFLRKKPSEEIRLATTPATARAGVSTAA
jgi:peptidoglycan/LPS O-acetylase OafA/YrhL